MNPLHHPRGDGPDRLPILFADDATTELRRSFRRWLRAGCPEATVRGWLQAAISVKGRGFEGLGRAERDAEIVRLAELGMKTKAIAQMAGLHHTRIYQIVRNARSGAATPARNEIRHENNFSHANQHTHGESTGAD